MSHGTQQNPRIFVIDEKGWDNGHLFIAICFYTKHWNEFFQSWVGLVQAYSTAGLWGRHTSIGNSMPVLI